MDTNQHNMESHLFLVRLWLQRGSDASADELWRGQVQHVITGQVGSFDGQSSLMEVLIALTSSGAALAAAEQDTDRLRDAAPGD